MENLLIKALGDYIVNYVVNDVGWRKYTSSKVHEYKSLHAVDMELNEILDTLIGLARNVNGITQDLIEDFITEIFCNIDREKARKLAYETHFTDECIEWLKTENQGADHED